MISVTSLPTKSLWIFLTFAGLLCISSVTFLLKDQSGLEKVISNHNKKWLHYKSDIISMARGKESAQAKIDKIVQVGTDHDFDNSIIDSAISKNGRNIWLYLSICGLGVFIFTIGLRGWMNVQSLEDKKLKNEVDPPSPPLILPP